MKLLVYILLLLAAVWSGLLLQQLPETLMLSCQNWSIEMPMWLAIAGLFLGIMAIFFLVQVTNEIVASFYNGKNYFRAAKKRAAQQSTTQALLQLAQAKWALAEKNAIKGVNYSELPFINYVSAAKAAQELQAWDRRDKYLALVVENVPNSEIAAGIIKAKLQSKQGAVEQSLSTLLELKKLAPKHPLVLNLLSEAYENKQDWASLLQIVPDLKKYNCCAAFVVQGLVEKAYQGLLSANIADNDKHALIKFWCTIPKAIRQNPRIVETYISCLSEFDAYKEANEILRVTLKKIWDQGLIKLYGLLPSIDLGKQIFLAETWLQKHPGDPMLLLTLARLCVRYQLWGKARDYLEMSIQFAPTPEAYAELGHLFTQLGEAHKSQECYRKGLLIVTKTLNDASGRQILQNTQVVR